MEESRDDLVEEEVDEVEDDSWKDNTPECYKDDALEEAMRLRKVIASLETEFRTEANGYRHGGYWLKRLRELMR